MSTTITVTPTRMNQHVNFQNVIEIAQNTMKNYFNDYNIDFKPIFKVSIHEEYEKYTRGVNPSEQFLWNKNEYAWFNIENFIGGTDAYCEKISDFYNTQSDIAECLCGDLVSLEQIDWIQEFDTNWYFRRSAGQPSIINLAYGHLAAALALLTEGVITSSDGAWDEKAFPTKPEDFLKIYFRPENTNSEANKDWAERSLKDIINNL